jgi:hypothetical protein
VDKNLIEDEHFARQFNLYLKYNKEKLMKFMTKTGKFPMEADKICA